MIVKFKKLDENAIIPSYAKQGDAGMDLTAISINVTDDYIEYGTGLAFEIPENHVGLLFPRSSISKKDLCLANAVGVIDSGYRGEVKLRFKILHDFEEITEVVEEKLYFVINEEKLYVDIYKIGDRIGQLIILPYPNIELEEGELSNSDRGEGSFGHTNK